jgi:PAS domain S-box-containing protein
MEPSSSLRARAGGLEVAPPVYADAQATLGDPERVAVLEATGLLDSEAEEAFDRLTRLAVRLVGVPAAFVSLVDAQRDFYKSACGFGEPLASARELTGPTFCHYTVQQATPLVIPDTAADPTWRAVPTVQTLGVAAYVGIPLVVDGQSIGAFCAIDMSPRAWSGDEIEILTELAASAQREIELRVAAATARQTTERLKEQQATLGAAVEQMRRQQLELERSNMQLQEQQVELEAQAAALQEGNANLEGALADAVRARRQAEQARSATEAAHVRTASLLEATADAYFALDEQLRVVAVNGAMERSTGLLREAMLGAEFLTLFPGAAGTDFERHYRCAVTERVEAHFTHDYSDGRLELVVEVDAYPATDGGVSVFWRDITEHVRAESALRASEARYRTLTEAVPVQVWTARPDGQLDFVSPRTIAYLRPRPRRARRRRGGEPRQERVPRRDVARAAHAAQRDRRLRGASRARRPGPGHAAAARGPRAHPEEPAPPARAHQRVLNYARVEAGAVHYDVGDVPLARCSRRARRSCAAGAREGARLRVRAVRPGAARARARPREAAADPAQPALERGQVHRPGRPGARGAARPPPMRVCLTVTDTGHRDRARRSWSAHLRAVRAGRRDAHAHRRRAPGWGWRSAATSRAAWAAT